MFLPDLHLRVDYAVHIPYCLCLAYNIIVTFYNLKFGSAPCYCRLSILWIANDNGPEGARCNES